MALDWPPNLSWASWCKGWPEQEIIRNYQLTADQVRARVAYAQERLNEEKFFAVVG